MSETDVDLDIAIGQCQARSLWQTLTGNPSADLNEQTRSRVLALLLELRDRRAAPVGSEVREEWGVRDFDGELIPLGSHRSVAAWRRRGLTIVRRTVTTTAWQVAE